MQNFLRFFGVLAAVVILVGLILPNDVDVRRSIEIDAPLTSIHALTNDLENWPKWSPWLAEDPSITIQLGEVTQGVGAFQSWKGASGNGSIKFIESALASGIIYEMNFEGDNTDYIAGLSYQEHGSRTVVTWYMTGEMKPVIVGNYFAQLMDTLVGDSFAQGLEKLKALAEAE